MTLQEMIARQRELTETARQQGRGLTAEEQREFDSLQAQIEAMPAGNQRENQPTEAGDGGEGSGEDEGAQRAVQAERRRIREIMTLCQRFGMDSQQYVERGDTLEQVRQAVLEELQRTNGPVGARVLRMRETRREMLSQTVSCFARESVWRIRLPEPMISGTRR